MTDPYSATDSATTIVPVIVGQPSLAPATELPNVPSSPAADPGVPGSAVADPGVPAVGDTSASPPLPLRTSRNIQGNVLAAFNKDHQQFRILTLPQDPQKGRAWLAGMVPMLADNQDVEDWNQMFSDARRANGGQDPQDVHVVWVCLSLTASGLEILSGTSDAVAGLEPALRNGAAASAASLGDTGVSDPSSWKFGGAGTGRVDVVVTVAADRPSDLEEKVAQLVLLDQTHEVISVFEQPGQTLPGPLRGHEHFGFKDGISQPGVIGFHAADVNGDRAGHPGTKMAEAGQFVFGQPGSPTATPAWMHDGSVQVLRRLGQNVPSWNQQVENVVAATSMDSTAVAACLMGRQVDGTPLAVAADASRGLGADGNDFDYANDPHGDQTPCAAHIRKAHPRSFAPAPRIMRRGIPYGPVFDGTNPDAERGLVFNCYVTSLAGQFEFIQQNWVNSSTFAAGGGPTGPDPVIGPAGTITLARPGDGIATAAVDRTVTTEGSVYGFAPSFTTLAALTTGKPLPI